MEYATKTERERESVSANNIQNTAQNKIDKYSKLASTHTFYPFAIETAGT